MRHAPPPLLNEKPSEYKLMRLPSSLLGQLAQALQHTPRASRFPAALWSRIRTRGWGYSSDVEDLLVDLDRRLYGIDLKLFMERAELPFRCVRDRPRFVGADWVGMYAMAATDIVALCIRLEECGFLTDATPMVADLYPMVSALATMTTSEADIYGFDRLRHRIHVRLQADERPDGISQERIWRSPAGYRFTCVEGGGQVMALSVRGAKWRAPRRIEMTCQVCGMPYTKGDPESAVSHRREHARVTRLLSPRPSARMREHLSTSAIGERVDASSPLWMHREVYERALRFKREFGYDSVQWHAPTKRARIDPAWTGYLFTAPDGAIDGACAFRETEEEWVLAWAWTRPERQRHGLLAARWPGFLERHGDFWLEYPLSEAMQGFITRHASEGQRRKIAERIRVAER